MRWKSRSLIAAGLTAAWTAPAFACGFPLNSTFLRIPSTTTLGIALQNWFTDYSLMTLAGDVAVKAGSRAVIRPAVGICREEAGSETESNVLFGAGLGFNVWNDEAGKMSVNLQAGLEMVSYDGASYRNIPIGAAVQMRSSDNMSLFGGASINMSNYSVDGGGDFSNSDPSLFGGVVFKAGALDITAGATIWMGDETDFALNVGASMALGGASNALRRFGSLIRR
jgi:hypothetical protein